jgi:hypothetical protein
MNFGNSRVQVYSMAYQTRLMSQALLQDKFLHKNKEVGVLTNLSVSCMTKKERMCDLTCAAVCVTWSFFKQCLQ